MWSDGKPFRDALPDRPRAPRGTGCVLIAEVAQSHDGSLGTAHAFIDAIADAGADAVKFQTHIAAAESTPAEPWRVRFSPQDATRYDYWKRMEFPEDAWQGLRVHAEERGLWFLSSPFSRAAVDLLERVGVAAWKVASGETGSGELLDAILATGRPVILSTGMSGWPEIDAAVARARGRGVPLALLQCTSAYPCPPEKVGVNVLEAFRKRYDVAAGLSDHSGKIFPGLAAATLGADVLEVHVALSRRMFGPDVPVSLVPEELALLVEGVRFIETMRAHPVDKDRAARETEPLRRLFTKSVVAGRDLAAGTILTREVLAVKKPGDGIPAARLTELVGARLLRDVRADERLAPSDVEVAR
jgi:N-acetylneuraminate synthase